jgi:hypothetical protein
MANITLDDLSCSAGEELRLAFRLTVKYLDPAIS